MAKRKSRKGPTAVIFLLLGAIIIGWQAYGRKLKTPEKDTNETVSSNVNHGNGTSMAESLAVVELPADVKSEVLEYPGFTVSFNSLRHQPNYVAWELTGEEAGSKDVKRSDNFAPDFKVDGCPTLDDYRGSGYDRGHMAPAGDMKWSREAMESCFLLTNMSPQAHDLNQGSWRSLEEKCRDWAVRDSAIMIVCGPIFTESPVRTIGSTGVAVPDSYFKVVLAPYADPPRAIGFVMPNGSVPGGMQASAMSVDDVEALTGLDFFPALPDDIENKVESECNFPRWSRKKY